MMRVFLCYKLREWPALLLFPASYLVPDTGSGIGIGCLLLHIVIARQLDRGQAFTL